MKVAFVSRERCRNQGQMFPQGAWKQHMSYGGTDHRRGIEENDPTAYGQQGIDPSECALSSSCPFPRIGGVIVVRVNVKDGEHGRDGMIIQRRNNAQSEDKRSE